MAGGYISSNGVNKNYPGKLTIHVFLICIAAACGGLIFGYDIGISGGVTSMPTFLEKFFHKVYEKEQHPEKQSDQYCKFYDNMLTLFTSSLYLAGMVSTCFASWMTRRFGRKPSMLAGGLLFLVGALVNGFANHVWMLIVGRALLGLGIGFANQAAPVYLSEMAPYKWRGACNMLFQLSITIGILAADIVNFYTGKMKGDLGWRLSLGGAVAPALLFIFCTAFLPDSPNSLIERGKEVEAREKLVSIRGTKDVEEEFQDLVNASIESKKIKHPWRNLLQRKHRPHLVFVTLIPAFQQLTGMNVFMFYAPVLFKTIGLKDGAINSTVVTGLINMCSTFVSIFTVDMIGRRFLFLEGGIQMLICQIIITVCIGTKYGIHGTPGGLSKNFSYFVVTAICTYVAGFAWSWGPLGWLVPCEILPLEIRSAGQTVNVFINMLFTFFVAEVFMAMMCVMKFGLFIFFAFFVVLMILFIWIYFPETKGVPIEEMQGIWKNHPKWRKYVIEEGDEDDKKIGGGGGGDDVKKVGGGGDVPKLPCV